MGTGASAGAAGAAINAAVLEASPEDIQAALEKLEYSDREKLIRALSPKPGMQLFQLGTNNWQRQGEFAPGSGILHEAHHNAMNAMDNISSWSMYPSSKQTQPEEADAMYRVFKLDHDIPICESASPTSSKRWHTMDEAEFNAYVSRMETEVYDYMAEVEKKTGSNFTHVIAHHSFVNPLVMRNVIKKRVAAGLPKCPIYCFVHGTALKMYRWEIGGKSPEEFPMRFHKMMLEEKIFDDQVDGVNAIFVISAEQKGGVEEIFPTFPLNRVIVAPNGINVEVFKPQAKTLTDVIIDNVVKEKILWPAAAPTEEECKAYEKMIIFCGKYAEWKRMAALLKVFADPKFQEDYPKVALLCAGGGQPDDIKVSTDFADTLGLKNTFLIGGRGQPVLAELYTVAEMGVFPSFKEPFGLVFVECMACKTPVIGANSGGPKDFVIPEVGCLVDEPPETTDLATVPAGIDTLSKTLDTAIRKALTEDWKKTKGQGCIDLALDKFTVGGQVKQMFADLGKLPPAEIKA